MNNELSQQGLGLIGLQNIKGPEINITQILGKSYQYQDLLDQLNTQQELFDLTPEANTEKRLKVSGKINELNSLIEQFKQDVLSLAATFEKIEINTERLKRAKEFFDKGELGEARAVLEIELEQMRDEQKHLLAKRDEFEAEILPKLLNNSEEFYVLAMATQVNFDNPNRFSEVCDYFERSIQSYSTQNNLYRYAYFLQEHNQFLKAEQYYERHLEQFAKVLSKENAAIILNNLAVVHINLNENEKALEEFKKALEICLQLDKTNPNSYLAYASMTLNNLAILYSNLNQNEKALECFQQALKNRRQLAETNSEFYLPYVATTLNNLAAIHGELNENEKSSEELQESLEICRQLAKTNPQFYLSYVAGVLNNLANLHWNLNENEKALEEFEEALGIYRKLAETNPQSYLPDVAMTSINLAIYYQSDVPDREKSIEYAILTVCIISPIVKAVPYTQRYLQAALKVLQKWGLSEEEIEQLVNDKMFLKDE
ncbi:MAG TPA: tetratricopeptide repeat protein [Pyrinomonadaceae bacterium]|jgi:tetratricopeptide (TPR) repeat protein